MCRCLLSAVSLVRCVYDCASLCLDLSLFDTQYALAGAHLSLSVLVCASLCVLSAALSIRTPSVVKAGPTFRHLNARSVVKCLTQILFFFLFLFCCFLRCVAGMVVVVVVVVVVSFSLF